MLRPRLNKNEKTVLIDLLVLMREVDDILSPDKLDLLEQFQTRYNHFKYVYTKASFDDIRATLEGLSEKSILKVLTHALLYVLSDNITEQDNRVIGGYMDLLSKESATKMQQSIDRESLEAFDVLTLYVDQQPEDTVLNESIELMTEFVDKTEEDIDETKLFNMNKGPVKKVWTEVLKLWEVVKDPKSDTAIKAMGIAALVYLISPIDVIPDFIPMLGLTDDVGVVMYAIAQLAKMRQNNK